MHSTVRENEENHSFVYKNDMILPPGSHPQICKTSAASPKSWILASIQHLLKQKSRVYRNCIASDGSELILTKCACFCVPGSFSVIHKNVTWNQTCKIAFSWGSIWGHSFRKAGFRGKTGGLYVWIVTIGRVGSGNLSWVLPLACWSGHVYDLVRVHFSQLKIAC